MLYICYCSELSQKRWLRSITCLKGTVVECWELSTQYCGHGIYTYSFVGQNERWFNKPMTIFFPASPHMQIIWNSLNTYYGVLPSVFRKISWEGPADNKQNHRCYVCADRDCSWVLFLGFFVCLRKKSSPFSIVRANRSEKSSFHREETQQLLKKIFTEQSVKSRPHIWNKRSHNSHLPIRKNQCACTQYFLPSDSTKWAWPDISFKDKYVNLPLMFLIQAMKSYHQRICWVGSISGISELEEIHQDQLV